MLTEAERARLARKLVDLKFTTEDEANAAIDALVGGLQLGEGREVLRVAARLFPADFARLFARTCNVQQLTRTPQDTSQ